MEKIVLSFCGVLTLCRYGYRFWRCCGVVLFMVSLSSTLAAQETSGKCGDSLSWEYDAATNTLTIRGTGEMYSYLEYENHGNYSTSYSTAPWQDFRIRKIVLQEGISDIGDAAFWGLRIDTLYMPKTVKSIGGLAFEKSTLSVLKFAGSLIDYCDLKLAVGVLVYDIWGDSYGYSAVPVLEKLFIQNQLVEDLTIPEGATMSSYPFRGYKGLRSVVFPLGMTSVSSHAFAECTGLKDIDAGNIETIGESSFEGCTALEQIDIGDLKKIGKSSFEGCVSLPEVYLDSIEIIGDEAFSACSSLKTIILGNRLQSIGCDAFSQCSLQDCYYAGTIEDWFAVEMDFRREYPNLTAAIVMSANPVTCSENFYLEGELVEKLNLKNKNISQIPDFSFYGYEKLQSIILPENLREIGLAAFAGTSITSLVIPKSLECVGYSCLNGCRALESCEFLSDSVSFEYIRDIFGGFFEFCTDLRTVVLPKYINCGDCPGLFDACFKGCVSLCKVQLPEVGLTEIAPHMFDSCLSLDSVSIPLSVETINACAFRNTNLQEISFGKNLKFVSENDVFDGTPIRKLYFDAVHFEADELERVFADWKNMEVEFGENIRAIGPGVFRNGGGIKAVDLSKVREIGASAFENCINLNSINHFSDSLRSLGSGAFSGCKKLQGDIIIPDSVTEIEADVFNGCLMLAGITLPPTTRLVDATAFTDNVNLKHLTVYSLEPPVVENQEAFENVDCPLRVPCMGAGIYRINEGWVHFKDDIEEVSPYRLVLWENNEAYGTAVLTTPATCESDIVTVSAVPAPLCHFVCWRDRSGNKLSEANPYVFALTSDLSLIAEFRSDADTVVWYTVDYDPMPEGGRVRVECEGVEVQPGGHLESGSVLSLQAEADAGYRFAAWWDGESVPSREYYLDADLEISATFTPLVSNEGLDKGLCRIWPNPADGRFYVELGRDACLEILSAQGVVVRPAMELDAGCHEVDMSGQAAGLYFLRLTASQESRVFKLLLR